MKYKWFQFVSPSVVNILYVDQCSGAVWFESSFRDRDLSLRLQAAREAREVEAQEQEGFAEDDVEALLE